jgi:hypothetical protein
MSQALLLVVSLLNLLLRNISKHKDCPDGLCVPALAASEKLTSQLQVPNLSFGVFDLLRFLRCFPMDRVMAVGKRIVAVFNGCDKCPDGECSFMDILGCVDLKEVIAIVTEILEIIRDSQVCDGGDSREITLGEAVS